MTCNTLDEVRSNIDRIDDNIIKLIAERGTYVSQASKFKKNEEGVKDSFLLRHRRHYNYR